MVLAATVYDLETGQPTGAKRFLNMVSATDVILLQLWRLAFLSVFYPCRPA